MKSSSTAAATAQQIATPPNNDTYTAIANETIELTNGAAMNVTKPVVNGKSAIDTCMDRSLTRSNTFVCETVDDTQAKLLSITHNINASHAPADTMSQAQQPNHLNKERTSKRSLSPIPGEPVNSAKRKLVHMPTNRKVTPGAMINSTPRRSMSHKDSRHQANLTFFSAKSEDLSSVEHLQTFILDNSNINANTFEQSNNFAPDAAVQLSRVANAPMHGNRVFDLTQTVEHQPNDTFYPENNRTIATAAAYDANAAEHELTDDGDAFNPNHLNDGGDGNLGKTITGECSCRPHY